MSESLLRVATGWRWATIRQGDTLQDIALRELGDAARWPELAQLNSLLPPYVTGDAAVATAAGNRVLLYGQHIRVFAASEAADATLQPEEVFGRDLALDARGMLTVGPNGDLATVAGLANLYGALARRVTTERRELRFHPTYGSQVRSALGRANTPARGLLAARSARLAVEQDSRVERVVEAVAQPSGDSLALTLVVEPIASGATMTLRVET